MKKYGLRSRKSNGLRTYGHLKPRDMRRVQRHYGIELGLVDDPLDLLGCPDQADGGGDEQAASADSSLQKRGEIGVDIEPHVDGT